MDLHEKLSERLSEKLSESDKIWNKSGKAILLTAAGSSNQRQKHMYKHK